MRIYSFVCKFSKNVEDNDRCNNARLFGTMRGSWSTNWLSPSYWNPALFYICIYIVMLLHTIWVKDWGTVRTAFFNYVIIAAPADVVLRIVNIMVIELFFFFNFSTILIFFLPVTTLAVINTKIYCEIGSANLEICA